MLFLLGGFAILCGLLLLGYLFVNADPAKLARAVKWGGLILGVLLCVALLVLTEGRLAIFVAPLLPLLPALRRVRSMFGGLGGGPAPGQTSDVETPFLRMTLDHDTGNMTGTVLRGRFAGMRFEELSPSDLLALLRECRAEDEESARLVEAYLDRIDPEWHDEFGREWAGSRPQAPGPDMTI